MYTLKLTRRRVQSTLQNTSKSPRRVKLLQTRVQLEINVIQSFENSGNKLSDRITIMRGRHDAIILHRIPIGVPNLGVSHQAKQVHLKTTNKARLSILILSKTDLSKIKDITSNHARLLS